MATKAVRFHVATGDGRLQKVPTNAIEMGDSGDETYR
jgi:hypothetical protein